MPLSHSLTFGYREYGDPEEHVESQRQKRKIDSGDRLQLEDIYENHSMKIEQSESIPKRHCQWLPRECQTIDFYQKEVHVGDVSMDDDKEIVPTTDISSNVTSDQIFTNCCQEESHAVVDTSTSMDSDCSPAVSHCKPRRTPQPASSPLNIVQGQIRRGLRPSPVSGRLYCHCSASWRGMYGLDTGYITDYY